MTYKAIAFDLDGTLIDTMNFTIKYFIEAVNKFRENKFSFDELLNHVGAPEDVIFRDIMKDEAIASKAYDYYKDLFVKTLPKIKLDEEMKLMLDSLLQKGLIIGLVTGRCRDLVEIFLNHLNMKNYFNIIITGNDLIHYKPNPEGLINFVNFTKLDKSEILYIGDMKADILAARNCGVNCGLVKWFKIDNYEVVEKPDYFLEKPMQIIDLL
ncbi:MAG: HAD-IA family hydrolase [Pseudomonadota bacterium]